MNYAIARVTFHTAPLPEPVYQQLMAIPGCWPWEPYGKRTAWTAPYTAAWIVERELQALGVPYRCTIPEVDALGGPAELAAAVAELRALALAAGVHAWVFDSFLLDFQAQCVVFSVDRERANVWAEPGAGKTLIAILTALLCAWLEKQIWRPILVITKSSVLGQTRKEWERFTKWRAFERRAPSQQRKRDEDLKGYLADCKAKNAPAIVIVGWDMISTWADELIALMPGMFTVFDESQTARSSDRKEWFVERDGDLGSKDLTNLTASAEKIARASTSGVLCTTATSIANVLLDLWGQLTLIEPDGWGITARRYAMRHCDPKHNGWGMTYKGMTQDTLPELQSRLAWSTIRIPYEVSHGQLPPKRRMLVRVSVEDQVAPLTGKMRALRALQKKAHGGDAEAEVQVARTELGIAASRKRKAIVEVLKDYATVGKGKIIVFSGVREDCEYLGEQLKKGTDSQVWVSHGEDSKEDREALREEFMAHPGPCILVGTWQAWGTGMNLDDADVIAFAMLPYTPYEVAQGEGRGDRISMKRPLIYLYFIADGTIDERLVDILSTKMEAVDAVLPGSRLGEFGGISDTLAGLDNADAIVSRYVNTLEAGDALDEGWE